ncbi:P-loop containing nucleoside triphosphate hydrolase protein [Aspergillus keveii]|uniref:P-loop containing nucleoside triphosphate hydrolase protein n=1 Tax=Aspergillus keveii TaxID=714993 RepID=A0ABR4FZ04_9EURO
MDLKAAADLDNEKWAHVLEIIDKLRDLGIGETVSLPQLVVVGDQSSGKSSLLEGLAGMSFPIASDLCTRFATQIVLRRAHQDDAGARITIIPGPGTPLDDELDTWLRKLPENLSSGPIWKRRAAEIMGLPGPNTKDVENISKRFSDDTLKIELSGPDQHHLSVVDVPGLFHNPTKYQTAEDRIIIRNLIQSYITDKRTIILRCCDGCKKQLGKSGGVLHGARSGSSRQTYCRNHYKVMRIAKNQVENLKHGWFVVKNRSTKEIQEGVTIEDRHVKEQRFFSTHLPWSELPKDRVCIHPLKKFLGLLLYEHIRSEFPNVVKDVETHLRAAQKALELLEPPRSTVNHYFADNLNAIREERVRARLQQAGYNDGQNVATNLLHVMKTIHLSNEQQAVYDIHDILKAYYKVALKRFTDNVVLQVVERHILGPNGPPVRAFSPDMVNDFDEGELMEIAGESFSTSRVRNELVAQCERFEKALNFAKSSGI